MAEFVANINRRTGGAGAGGAGAGGAGADGAGAGAAEVGGAGLAAPEIIRVNVGAMTDAAPNDNEVCLKCKNKKHGRDCWKCGSVGHRKRDCPKMKKNRQGGNNRGAVYKLRAMDAQQDPKVVT
nr:hypothetical protein [Tanacetum cinerariifolium]